MDRGRKEGEVFGSLQGGGECGFVELLKETAQVGGGVLDMGDGEDGEEVSGGFLLGCPSSYLLHPPSSSFKMLCFGKEEGSLSGMMPQKSSISANESSSSTSSSSSNSNVYKSKTEGRRAAPSRERTVASVGANTTKKPRKEQAPASHGGGGAVKVRKEKLGERITALQQLVSPFGKSDTASVLHEALGYIRFLHDQVQVLSSPYLQRLPSSAHLHGAEQEADGSRSDLRSRGLCLVPLSCTAHVADSNGADFWSPAMGNTNSPAFPKH